MRSLAYGALLDTSVLKAPIVAESGRCGLVGPQGWWLMPRGNLLTGAAGRKLRRCKKHKGQSSDLSHLVSSSFGQIKRVTEILLNLTARVQQPRTEQTHSILPQHSIKHDFLVGFEILSGWLNFSRSPNEPIAVKVKAAWERKF